MKDPSHPRCHVCGGRIQLTDPFTDRRTLDENGATTIVRGHRACLKEGVDRWNRENRPHGGPLEASRRDSWSWHTEPVRGLDG